MYMYVWRGGYARLYAHARAHAIRVYLYVARRVTRARLSVVRLFSFFVGWCPARAFTFTARHLRGNVMLFTPFSFFKKSRDQLKNAQTDCASR